MSLHDKISYLIVLGPLFTLLALYRQRWDGEEDE